MSNSHPTIVLVHGAWHTPANYQTFIDALQKVGFPVYCPQLPSCNNTSPPPASLAEDVAVVRAVLQERVAAGEQVILIMHSYGGLVGTDAVRDSLLYNPHNSSGRSGGIIHLLYLCAYMLEPGTSVFDIAKAADFFPYWDQYIQNFDDGTCFPIDPAAILFGDDGTEEDVKTALTHLVRSPLAAFDTKSEGECWKKVPVTYVKTLRDGGVPIKYQDIMLERVEKTGTIVEKVELDTTHSVFITRQVEIVDVVRKIARVGESLH
ncbi:alpha/beta-hydrolase [Lophiostoma macrostomum CBS 122681]|uniref:Alpha/beta-hydrolase n=1 Tax=Lophiostoma macrostomum CBS 122681 TaxID=1314788 RepID=A0A6A6SUB0_9PLEO|nr:alpha/beta-hydrolase [Lophiostoma macrostomum CBS 122681]